MDGKVMSNFLSYSFLLKQQDFSILLLGVTSGIYSLAVQVSFRYYRSYNEFSVKRIKKSIELLWIRMNFCCQKDSCWLKLPKKHYLKKISCQCHVQYFSILRPGISCC